MTTYKVFLNYLLILVFKNKYELKYKNPSKSKYNLISESK